MLVAAHTFPGDSASDMAYGHVAPSSILVVEPSAAVRHQVGVAMRTLGHDAKFVDSAAGAHESIAKMAPRVVLCEFVGDTDAERLGFIQGLLDADPELRVVLVTAEDPNSALVRGAVRAGAFAVVPKPLRQERLRAVFNDIEAEDGGIQRLG